MNYMGVDEFAIDTASENVFTPAAVFPLILASNRVGLVWLNYMLTTPNTQTPYGTVEAFNASSIAPLLTWDTKFPIVLSVIDAIIDESCALQVARGGAACGSLEGGVSKQMAYYMKRDSIYTRFITKIETFYQQFSSSISSTVPYALPYTM